MKSPRLPQPRSGIEAESKEIMRKRMWMRAAALRAAAFTLAALAAVAGPAPATAQTVERAGAQRDWSVFAMGSGDQRVCWVMTKPTEWRAERGGRSVDANRGDIYLMVANRPAQGVENEVSWVSGYPLRDGETVRLRIGDERFSLFADGENAWPENPAADGRVVEAMKQGVTATATGVSTRGTTTTDTFSLLGFTAALEEAQRLCA